MENLLLKIVKKSKYVTVEPDVVDDVEVIRLIVEHSNIKKINFITWMCMNLLDSFSGFYGYRITISNVSIRIKI